MAVFATDCCCVSVTKSQYFSSLPLPHLLCVVISIGFKWEERCIGGSGRTPTPFWTQPFWTQPGHPKLTFLFCCCSSGAAVDPPQLWVLEFSFTVFVDDCNRFIRDGLIVGAISYSCIEIDDIKLALPNNRATGMALSYGFILSILFFTSHLQRMLSNLFQTAFGGLSSTLTQARFNKTR